MKELEVDGAAEGVWRKVEQSLAQKTRIQRTFCLFKIFEKVLQVAAVCCSLLDLDGLSVDLLEKLVQV